MASVSAALKESRGERLDIERYLQRGRVNELNSLTEEE